ncbi:MAG: ferredoxin [Acidimicrobiia bacterium]
MRVWIDQDLCTGDALCAEVCPSVFTLEGSLSYVREASGRVLTDPGAMAPIPDEHLEAVIEAAEECPGECIFIEP